MKIDDQRAAGYTRVSTVEQSMPDKPSLDQQRARIEATCRAQDFDLVQVYQDVISGAKSDRPGLKQMLEDAKAGEFGRLVFLKTDRLGRNLKDLLDISDALRDAGIDLVSVVEGFDTRTAVGRMFFQFLGMFAEFERETIKQRTAGGRVGKMQAGSYMPSIAPYGYQIDRKSLVLNMPIHSRSQRHPDRVEPVWICQAKRAGARRRRSLFVAWRFIACLMQRRSDCPSI